MLSELTLNIILLRALDTFLLAFGKIVISVKVLIDSFVSKPNVVQA